LGKWQEGIYFGANPAALSDFDSLTAFNSNSVFSAISGPSASVFKGTLGSLFVAYFARLSWR